MKKLMIMVTFVFTLLMSSMCNAQDIYAYTIRDVDLYVMSETYYQEKNTHYVTVKEVPRYAPNKISKLVHMFVKRYQGVYFKVQHDDPAYDQNWHLITEGPGREVMIWNIVEQLR